MREKAPLVLIPDARRLRAVLLAGVAIVVLGVVVTRSQSARAQLGSIVAGGGGATGYSKTEPVTFTADQVQYDRDGAMVTATGHVEAWQGDRVLRADKITFDRNTNVAAATGHVVLLEPDGEVLFSEYAELTQGMRDGILRDMTARLAENGRLAANGARRVNAQVNELSRAIYSTCNACKAHPENPLLWDIRARSAVQDVVNKRIEYTDALIDLDGVPVAYFPYLSQPDPSVKRASGFLVPSIGTSSHLGAFTTVPYYWVIDDQSDATIAPLLATNAGPAIDLQYRRRFNNGTVTINGSIAYDQGALQGDVFAKGNFVLDDTFRWGFDIERASNESYILNYRLNNVPSVLTSQIFLEGFGDGAYTKLDARLYQGLTTSVVASELPYVLPRYQYSFVGNPDALGGRLGVDLGTFNVLRGVGTNTQRGSLSVNWERPFTGSLGDLYKLVLHVDSAAYNATGLNLLPNFNSADTAQSAQSMPSVSVDMHWPFLRDNGISDKGDGSGSQLIEPIVQLVGAPNGSTYGVNTRIPNEDSLDQEFTDRNLFSLNRFPGIDRLEGGMRASVALHAAWNFDSGAVIDGLIGQSYREKDDKAFTAESGLQGKVSDVVGHVSFTPNKYFDLTSQYRLNHDNFDVRFVDALASGGPDAFRLNAGYLYSAVNPYLYYDQAPTAAPAGPPRNEVSLGGTTKYGPWKLSGSVRDDIRLGKLVTLVGDASYEDECFIFDAKFIRRYTSVNNDGGSTTLLFTVTLKTVGQFGFHAS
jgi:LPS-assembly protein